MNEEIKQGPDYIFQKRKSIKDTRIRRIRNRRLFYLGVFLLILLLAILYYYSDFSRFTFINISGNERMSESELLKIIDVREGDLRITNSNASIREKLLNSPFIESAAVKRKLNGELDIEITEITPLCYFYDDTILVLTDKGKTVEIPASRYSWLIDIPKATNFYDNDYEELTEALNSVKPDVLHMCLEIVRYPLSYNTSMMYFYMNDGNYVFMDPKLTDNLNYYYEILKNLKSSRACIFVDDYSKNAYTSVCPWDRVEEEIEDGANDE